MTIDELFEQMTEDQKKAGCFFDDLTGAYNRKALMAEYKEGDVIAIFDLDSLKWVNDNHGSHIADMLLQQLVERLSNSITPPIKVYRLSGDEFAIIQPPRIINRVVLEASKGFDVFSFGIGKSIPDADRSLKVGKAIREKFGARSGRGIAPPWADQLNSIVQQAKRIEGVA